MEFLDYDPDRYLNDNSEFNYNYNLKRFLRVDEGATELDFINSEILKNEKIIEGIPVLIDTELIQIIESKHSSLQKTSPNYKEYILHQLEVERKKLSRKRQGYLNGIEDLIIRKNRLPQPAQKVTTAQNTNPFPEIFNGDDDKAFNVFNDFAIEVTDYYLDYSFIFQKMKSKEENLIKSNYRHKSFMNWLLENKFITEKTHNDFFDKETFSSKADKGMRPTRYYSIKNRHFPTVTD
ncbi:uncharacterized protein YbaR (Trm112 family) [Flavobacterium sp. CG_9.10]|uniref:hypothetical protein n=1 Tax=Flavobacterium sp. CG_9.10 TaxID=2787729 RepID=UPI0018C9AC71|nr:hypothetical protein [Flavobacterium sp. CG_9.10]MBG6109344.1 uncharacterized protein YbaR (Trm112 family) [Flavobacterium sp. CG_9.10]